ncbi:MAG: anti-sigma factor [Deltaproteobacteria bacterium]|nr:anti-sigma factor [Deltaproteobacteria bacterium]
MNHGELIDLLPLYALGGLDTESVAEVERHLVEPCESCTAGLREWQEVMGLIPLGLAPVGPSAVVKERLMARVRQDLGAKVIPLRPWRKRAAWMALPLAAAVLVVIGGLRYQEAVKIAAEQAARAEMVGVLLAQEQEKLASRESEIQQITARLEEQQAAAAEKAQAVAQLEAALAEQRRLVSLREQELARAQSAGTQGRITTAAYEREIAELKADLARQRNAATSSEQELRELRVTLEQQCLLTEASARETEQLRDALARQRGVVEVLAAPGLRVASLGWAKRGVDSRGHVVWNEEKKTWLFYAFGMPQPPPGKEYQVWFMTEQEGPVSAGLFTPDQTGTGVVLAAPPSKLFGKVTAAAVTLEPAGGLPKPSGEMYLRGSL